MSKPIIYYIFYLFLGVLCISCTGCDYYKNKHYMTNVYFNSLYAEETILISEYIGNNPKDMNQALKKENYNTRLEKSPFIYKYDFEIKQDFSLSNSLSWGHNFTSTDFYQDKAKQCYLFSYSIEELIKMREATSLWWNDAIYIIQKDGISVISKSEYKKLKPTFKPHPYDASLCKPAPKE